MRYAGYLGYLFQKRGSMMAVLATWDIRSQKKPLENDRMAHSPCRRETAKVQAKSVDVFHALVPLTLFAKEKPVSHGFTHLKRLRALCFHVLHNGFVRWMRPHNTSLLHATIA